MSSNYLETVAQLLSEGWEPDEIGMRQVVEREVITLVRQVANFELIASNKDRPDHKYGTHPNGKPMHAPEWYAVQGVVTGIHERIGLLLSRLFACPVSDRCGLDIGHDGACWDSQRGEWVNEASE